MEKFFAEHVGGRFQDEIKPEYKERLEDITVDIDSVEVAKMSK